MEPPKRSDFSEIPDHLICKCGEDTIFQDQTILGLGIVCIKCAKYCDEAYNQWQKEKERETLNYVQSKS